MSLLHSPGALQDKNAPMVELHVPDPIGSYLACTFQGRQEFLLPDLVSVGPHEPPYSLALDNGLRGTCSILA